MWDLANTPWWEFILRALIVYGAILILLRISGKRRLGDLSPSDLVLLLLISNAVQNAMNAGNNSVTGGLILAAALVGCNCLIGWVASKNKRFSHLIEGQPLVLVHNGEVLSDALQRSQLSLTDLKAELRLNGVISFNEVHVAILESNGKISVHTKKADQNRSSPDRALV